MVLLAMQTAPAVASTITVTTADDVVTAGEGRCSLRQAITAVNLGATTGACAPVGAGAPTIVLGPRAYGLTILPAGLDDNASGDLDISAPSVTITGAGAATMIDARALGDRALDIAAAAHVTLSNLTLSGGHALDGQPGAPGVGSGTPQNGGMGGQGADGGGIRNAGTLTLDHVTVTASHAGNGGSGGAGATPLLPGDTATAGGRGGAGGQGGGIYSTGTLTVADSTVSSNHAGSGGRGGSGGNGGQFMIGGAGGAGGIGHEDGGGIAIGGGTGTISGSTIDDNTSGSGGPGGAGGGGSSFAGVAGVGGNASWGGGLSAVTATVTITNSTIADNHSGDGGAGGLGGVGTGGNGGNGGNAGHGGAIRSTSATVTLTNVTVVGNALGSPGAGGLASISPGNLNGTSGSAGVGGGLYVEGTPLVVQNSIVASNTGGNCAAGSPVTDGGANLQFGDTSCPATFASADPKLQSLTDNAGPTQTEALGVGSAAIDRFTASCPRTDQRGVARPGGAKCDIGAYEAAPPAVSTRAATNVTSTSATLTATVTPNSGLANAGFVWGPSVAYGSQTPTQRVKGITPQAITTVITRLTPNTTYHFAAVIGSPEGTDTGGDATFRTAAIALAAPKLTHLRLTPATLKAHHSGRVTYTDNAIATTTFVVFVRKHRTYVALKHRITHRDMVGRNSFRFGARLAPGRYKLTATPRANGKTGKTLSVRFKVAAPSPRRR